ncbi:RRQRL motif-containing zinc-binding protein [Glycomyces tarimensis]
MFRAEYDDPDGSRYGLPTYNYRHAPGGLYTRRQLAAVGLTPGRQPKAAQIIWRRGKRIAYLYRRDLAQPKRPATPAQLRALMKAWVALSTCPTCNTEYDYYISKRYGECLACYEANVGHAVESSVAQ